MVVRGGLCSDSETIPKLRLAIVSLATLKGWWLTDAKVA